MPTGVEAEGARPAGMVRLKAVLSPGEEGRPPGTEMAGQACRAAEGDSAPSNPLMKNVTELVGLGFSVRKQDPFDDPDFALAGGAWGTTGTPSPLTGSGPLGVTTQEMGDRGVRGPRKSIPPSFRVFCELPSLQLCDVSGTFSFGPALGLRVRFFAVVGWLGAGAAPWSSGCAITRG